jgi:hypothetical protein
MQPPLRRSVCNGPVPIMTPTVEPIKQHAIMWSIIFGLLRVC